MHVCMRVCCCNDFNNFPCCFNVISVIVVVVLVRKLDVECIAAGYQMQCNVGSLTVQYFSFSVLFLLAYSHS